MESSPLIKAGDHAKAAAKATHASETTVAINEHTRAAGEFANAAKDTTSVEALRTLKLLEQHHQRLSEILQIDLKKPTRGASAGAEDAEHQDDEKSTSQQADSSSLSAATAADNSLSEKAAQQPMPTLHRPPRYPSRDLGASIASNLASARGIRSKYRSQPLSPSMTSTEAPGSVESAQGNKGESRSRIQNMLEHADKPGPQSPQRKQLTRQASSGSDTSIAPASPVRSKSPPQDEGFSKFYSAFGTIMNRISAPLAFAGLPLISEDQTEEPATVAPAPEITTTNPRRTRLKPSPSVLAEPDISKIYSKATLRAISRDGQLASDSFYVVPTSGHTTTYANILKFEDKEKRRMEASLHSNMSEHLDDDDFVDARESQAPDSPGGFVRRRAATAGPVSSAAGPSARRSRAEKENLSTIVEELRLENKSLKDMLDKLSKRLHAFESMSQNSGMRLAESMRLMRPGSPGSITGGTGAGSGSGNTKAAATTTTSSGNAEAEIQLRRKNRELEDQLTQAASRMEQLEKDYSQARANLGRYRERWEQLKAGAKARRAGGGGASSVGSAGAGGGTGGGGSLGGLGSGDGRFDEEGRGGSMSPSLALSRDR